MKNSIFILTLLTTLSCQAPQQKDVINITPTFKTHNVNSSIRAIEVINDNNIWYAGSNGQYGYTNDAGKTWQQDSIKTDSFIPHFRAIAHTNKSIFLLSIESPALLYKSDDSGKNWTIIYREEHPKAFYDAMVFWDDKEGIAMGDPTEDCLSIIITRDGGQNWNKIPCENLPKAAEGEAAFAASNSNISVIGNHVWIVSGGKKSRVFHSLNRGKSWEVFDTPISQGGKMTGIFSVDFLDIHTGIVFGGDWEKQEQNSKNKATTNDGGRTWQLISDGQGPGYRSSVRYLPKGGGKKIMAVGIPGISFSDDGGQSWRELSNEPFYTVRFGKKKNVAWLAGNKKITRMDF